MTPTELHAARKALGLTQGAFAAALGVTRRSVQFWEAGDRAIPETVARLVRLAVSEPQILVRLASV
jgi:DNA-binding transcriptional regulator YiaG